MAVLKHFTLQCEGCQLTSDDLALISRQFELQKVDYPRFYGSAMLIVSSFNGMALEQARDQPGFAEVLERLLTFLSVKSQEVYYTPNHLKWTSRSRKDAMTARQAAERFPPNLEYGRVRLQVRRVPPIFPRLDKELATDHYSGLPVNCFSGDGRRLLTVHSNRIARVWDLASERLVGEIVARSPREGTRLYPGYQDKDEEPELFATFIEAALLNRDGTKALLGLNDGSAGLYDLQGAQLLTLTEPGAKAQRDGARQIRAIAISSDESMLAVGFFERKLAIWTSTGDLIRTLQHPLQDRMVTSLGCRDTLASSISFSPDDRHLFAGFGDTTGGLWEVASGQLLVDVSLSAHELLGMRLVDDELVWTTAGGEVWRCEAGADARRVLDTQEWWSEAAVDASGTNVLACCTKSGEVQRWDWTGSRTELGQLTSRVYSRNVTLWQSPRTASSLYQGSPSVLTLSTPLRKIEVDGASDIVGLAISKDETIAHLSRADLEGLSGVAQLLDLSTGEATEFSAELSKVAAFSQDGRWLARHLRKHKVMEIWEVGPRKLVASIPWSRQVERIEFTSDGSHLVSTDWSGRVILMRIFPPHPARFLDFDDLDHFNLVTLSDSRILVFRHSGIEIWRGLETMLARLDVPNISKYDRRQWVLSADETSIVVALGNHEFERFSVEDGSHLGRYAPRTMRPLISSPLIWQLEGNLYYHQADYLRGGFRLVPVSEFSPVTIANDQDGTAWLMALNGSPTRIRRLEFEGYLRAGWLGQDEVLLLNHRGRLFRTIL